MSKVRTAGTAAVLLLIPAALAPLAMNASNAAEAPLRFARTYSVTGSPHLSISCAYGDITVIAWNRKELSVRAVGPPYVLIRDSVMGSAIDVFVMQAPRMGKVDFQIQVPAYASAHLRNRKGDVYVSGLTGHVDVDAGDGVIRFGNMHSSSIDARVVSGDIFFDGELSGEGPYTFQSMKGNVDITLPASSSFNLSARALSDQINIGDFILSAIKRHPKFISGQHARGGPPLNLVTYDGRVLLHKK